MSEENKKRHSEDSLKETERELRAKLEEVEEQKKELMNTLALKKYCDFLRKKKRIITPNEILVWIEENVCKVKYATEQDISNELMDTFQNLRSPSLLVVEFKDGFIVAVKGENNFRKLCVEYGYIPSDFKKQRRALTNFPDCGGNYEKKMGPTDEREIVFLITRMVMFDAEKEEWMNGGAREKVLESLGKFLDYEFHLENE